ncbi:PAS domain S-box protein [Pedobacter sp. GR22-6]|uniref:PAS domain S-box protein n=1 Tax=Pedobacter sp. GR22-6 TaxID=3127957 RepID=UPI00307F3C06
MNEQQTPDFKQQLFEYQKRIANILESFTDAFFELDVNWNVTYWNKEAERILDMPRTKMIGKNLWEVYSDAIPLKFYSEYHRAMHENLAVRFEEYFPAKELWIEVAAFPSGSGLSVYFKDITEKKQALDLLQRERQKYVDLFNLSPLPQWVYDKETLSFLDVNEAAIRQYGYTHEEFLSMTLKDIRPAEDAGLIEEIVGYKVVEGKADLSLLRHVKKNGELIYVSVKGDCIQFEGKKARLVMVVDMTEEFYAKAAMEAQNLRLKEIAWIQSHQIRAPLARILGLVYILNQEPADLATIKDFLPMLQLSAEQLDAVLNEIVDSCQ